MPLEQGSVGHGIDPKLAYAIAPALDASRDLKAEYSATRYAAQNDHYVGFMKTWTKALNFLIGEHWRSRWDGMSLTWAADTKVPPWRQQPVTNLTYAVYRTAQAKLTKQKPTLEVVPSSGDSQEKEQAELEAELLTHLWRYLKMPNKVRIFIGWLLITSTSFWRVGWDPEAGALKPRTVPMSKKVAHATSAGGFLEGADHTSEDAPDASIQDEQDESDEQVDVAADENGEPYKKEGTDEIDYDRKPTREAQGEIAISVVSPLGVRYNPDATSPEEADEWYVASSWTRSKTADHFGIDEAELSQSDESSEQRNLYENLVSATAAGFPRSWADQVSMWGVSQEGAIGNRVLVVEFYSKPCNRYPEGRHWISCGPKMVWPKADDKNFPNNEAPLPFGFWPPLVAAVDTPVPGQPSGVALITQAVPLNEQLNTLDGKIAEKNAMDAMGGIWIASPEDKTFFKPTSEPGQVQYSQALKRAGSGHAPYQAKLNGMPPEVLGERNVIVDKLLAVTSMSTVDLTSKPVGTPSGRALLVTQETSDAVLMPTLMAMEEALEEVGRRQLVIAQQKYHDTRLIQIKQPDGQWLFRKFRGADLSDGHDVRVQVGSSFPFSKSAQWDTRLEFLRAMPGLVINPKTGEVNEQKLARYLEPGAPGLQAFETEENPDAIEIRQEHLMLENFDPTADPPRLQIPQIAMWQSHAIHLKEHFDFMKRNRSRFEKWHPLAQQAFVDHMELTQQAVTQQIAAMMGGEAPAPPGEETPPADGGAGTDGRRSPQLVRPETASPGPGTSRLTRADRASAHT